MTELAAARSSMAFSLAFHIIFSCIGMTMPFLMSISHYRFLKTGRSEYLELTKMWSKGVAILFAVGAVSGTVLSFELGLLWPSFMRLAGPVIGMPFSWEGTAFFLEAVAIGLFLYGWDRLKPWVHWWTGIVVGVSGFASGIFVVAANSWMNTPQGFTFSNGKIENIEPVKAMFNPAWLHQSLHMQVAALQAVGLAAAGIHAYLLLKKRSPKLNLAAMKIAMAIGASAAIIQPFVGHFSAQRVAELQPMKLAALEGHFETSTHAPVYIGGIPDAETETMRYGIPIPGGLSFLAFNSFRVEVKGLNEIPKADWPAVVIVHLAFQLMVAIGSGLALLGVAYFYFLKKGNFGRKFLTVLALASPLGFVGVEAGWVVTETGRQPWIIYQVLRTETSVTPVPGMIYHFIIFVIIYMLLAFMVVWLLWRQIQIAHGNTVEVSDV